MVAGSSPARRDGMRHRRNWNQLGPRLDQGTGLWQAVNASKPTLFLGRNIIAAETTIFALHAFVIHAHYGSGSGCIYQCLIAAAYYP